MDANKNEKHYKEVSRKTIFGIKLPPIDNSNDAKVKTIIDVDPEFYSMVEGRPIRPNTSYHTYKGNIKDLALKRTLYGFVKDEILRIDREIDTEKAVYEKASKHFEEYQNSFDKFLADDNNKTIEIMQKSDALDKELAHQTEEHKQAEFELASMKSKLQYIDESLQILLSCENFLHKASPILWLEKQNIKPDVKHEDIIVIDNDIFKEIDKEAVEEKIKSLPPPRLYFETPEQMLDVFDQTEKQNLNYLLVTEELALQKNKFLKVVTSLKNVMQDEVQLIQKNMADVEEVIRWNEMRESDLQDLFYRVLEQKMRQLISSETALEIFNYVEFAYEQILAPNETKLNSYDMMLAIESEYNNIMLDLSRFDLETLKKIEKETYENGVFELKQAKVAHKLLKDVDKLNKRLKASYEPSRRKTII